MGERKREGREGKGGIEERGERERKQDSGREGKRKTKTEGESGRAGSEFERCAERKRQRESQHFEVSAVFFNVSGVLAVFITCPRISHHIKKTGKRQMQITFSKKTAKTPCKKNI